MLRAPSIPTLNVPRDRAPTTSLGKLCQCSTSLILKKCCPISDLNGRCFSHAPAALLALQEVRFASRIYCSCAACFPAGMFRGEREVHFPPCPLPQPPAAGLNPLCHCSDQRPVRVPCIPRCAASPTIAKHPLPDPLSHPHPEIPALQVFPGSHPWKRWGFPGHQNVAAGSPLMPTRCGPSSLCAVVGSSPWRCVKPGSIGTSLWASLWHTKPLFPGTASPREPDLRPNPADEQNRAIFSQHLQAAFGSSSLAQQTPPNRSALSSQQSYARNFSPKAAGPFPKKESCQIPTSQPPAAKQGANLAPGGFLLASTSALAVCWSWGGRGPDRKSVV